MSFTPLPMDVDRPVVWLVALVAIATVGVGLGIGWSHAQVSLVEFHVHGDGADSSVDVAAERFENGSFRSEKQETLAVGGSEDESLVWTTREPGWYRVRLVGDEGQCEMRVSVKQAEGRLLTDVHPDRDGTCPAELRVREVERPFWQVEDGR